MILVPRQASSLGENLKTYVELDFPEITTKKAMAIKKSKELMSGLGDSDRVTLSRDPTISTYREADQCRPGWDSAPFRTISLIASRSENRSIRESRTTALLCSQCG